MSTELYFLGAGRPASGTKPAALKHISINTKAMDWQLHSFEDVVKVQDTYFLGGYHVDDVVKAYPDLNFTIVPNWFDKHRLSQYNNFNLSYFLL
jgi:hypothetical protein